MIRKRPYGLSDDLVGVARRKYKHKSTHTHTHTHDQTTDGAQNHVRDRESVHRGPSALLECQQATEQSLDANRRLSRARGIRVFTNSVRKEGWLEQHTELHFISLDI